MRPTLVLTIASFLAACGGTARSVDASGAPAVHIRDVHFVGRHHVGYTELASGLASQPPSGRWWWTSYADYDPAEVEIDRQRIVASYQQHGYLDARVTAARVLPVDSGGVEVTFTVDEGPPTRVGSVEIVGAPAGMGLGDAGLRGAYGLAPADLFEQERHRAGKARLRAALEARGYLYAEVTADVAVDAAAHRAAIVVTLAPGPRARFGALRIEGGALVPASAVLGRVAWRAGDVFDPELVALTETRLAQLGRFSSVRVSHERVGDTDVVTSTIHLVESKRHELRLGGGVGLDSAHVEVRGRFGLATQGFLFPMTTGRLDVKPSYSWPLEDASEQRGFDGVASASLVHDDFLAARLRFTNALEFSVSTLDAYTLYGPRARLALERPFLRDRLTAGASWQLRYQWFSSVDAAISTDERATLGLASPYRLGAFEQSLVYDGRDDALEPHRGLYAALQAEEGGSFAGGAFGYAKLTPELRGYLALGGRLVLAARSRLGWGLPGRTSIPITQRYFAGGPSSHRGFPALALAPHAGGDGSSAAIGGEGLFESSLELRAQLTELGGLPLGVAAFLDGADVTLAPADLELTNLHWAAGLGARLYTPIGPLRLDAGYRLNRTGAGELGGGRLAIFLSLGEAF